MVISDLYVFPPYGGIHLIHLFYAVGLGLVGVGVAVLLVAILKVVGVVVAPLATRPVLRATLGGLCMGVLASFIPMVLFSGEHEFQTLLDHGAEQGVWMLLLIALGKMLTTSISISTGFKGGLIFPVIFIGGTVGTALSLLLPFIPPGVAIVAVMAATIVTFLKIPISTLIFLSVIFPSELVPVMTVAVIVGFIAALQIQSVQQQRQQVSDYVEHNGEAPAQRSAA